MKRTTELMPDVDASVVRFTDLGATAYPPSDESLGYCQPSANAD